MTDDNEPNDVTQLLLSWSNGNKEALDRLIPLVYNDLRRRARGYLRRENPGHTLQTTALVNEAYLRLVDQNRVQWQNRSQFFGVAAQLMRRILVDHAKKKGAAKRGGQAAQVTLDDLHGATENRQVEILAMDQALSRLAEIDADAAKVVELRFFTGLSVEETSEVIGVSPATVKRDWNAGKAWLARELRRKKD